MVPLNYSHFSFIDDKFIIVTYLNVPESLQNKHKEPLDKINTNNKYSLTFWMTFVFI